MGPHLPITWWGHRRVTLWDCEAIHSPCCAAMPKLQNHVQVLLDWALCGKLAPGRDIMPPRTCVVLPPPSSPPPRAREPHASDPFRSTAWPPRVPVSRAYPVLSDDSPMDPDTVIYAAPPCKLAPLFSHISSSPLPQKHQLLTAQLALHISCSPAIPRNSESRTSHLDLTADVHVFRPPSGPASHVCVRAVFPLTRHRAIHSAPV